ncbi:MAG: hypothetical protein MJZ33_02970 [Paludibacteraceae bacterium]|nr:hypothetical protein [Paludibacteraceae bacterium]
MASMHTASGKVERYSYDPFGRRRSADNWMQDAFVQTSSNPRNMGGNLIILER